MGVGQSFDVIGTEQAHDIEKLQDFDCQHAMRMADFAVIYVYYEELYTVYVYIYVYIYIYNRNTWNITWTYPNIGDAPKRQILGTMANCSLGVSESPGPHRPRSLVQAVLEQPSLLS